MLDIALMNISPDISFVRLERSDFALVRHIEVAPEQIIYCGTVDMAFASDEAGIDLYAVRAAGTCVGFFKIDLKYPKTQDFARDGDLGLRAFMIDRWRQGSGLGSATLRALPEFLRKTYPDAQAIVLTVNIRNQVAVRRYLSTGFTATGDVHDGGHAGLQYVMRQMIAPPRSLHISRTMSD